MKAHELILKSIHIFILGEMTPVDWLKPLVHLAHRVFLKVVVLIFDQIIVDFFLFWCHNPDVQLFKSRVLLAEKFCSHFQ